MSYGGNFNAKRENSFRNQYDEQYSTDSHSRPNLYSSDQVGRHPNGNNYFNEGISSNYAAKTQPLHDDDDNSALFGRKPSADLYGSKMQRKIPARKHSKSLAYASATTNLHTGGPKTDERYNDISFHRSESNIDHEPSLRSSTSEVHRTVNRPILAQSTTGGYRSTSKSRNNRRTTDIQQFLDSTDSEDLADGRAYGVNISHVQDPYPSMLNDATATGVYSSNGEPLADMNILTKKEAPKTNLPEGEISEGLGYGINISDLQDPYPSMLNNSTAQGVYSSHLPPGSGGGKPSAHAHSAHKIVPPTKEATPIMPPNVAVEPKITRPRVSRRFLRYTQPHRQPDSAHARRVDNARYMPGEEN